MAVVYISMCFMLMIRFMVYTGETKKKKKKEKTNKTTTNKKRYLLTYLQRAGPRGTIGRAPDSYPVWQHTFVSPSAFSRRAVVSYWRKCVHEVLVNRLGGLSLPRKVWLD